MIIEIYEGERQWSADELVALDLSSAPTIRDIADAVHAKGYRIDRAACAGDKIIAHVARLGPTIAIGQDGASAVIAGNTTGEGTIFGKKP